MRIKHWAGYGTIDCKKSLKKLNDQTILTVILTGNHERGLERRDHYDLFNWYVKRFDKSQTDFSCWMHQHPEIEIESDYIKDARGCDVETCKYTFIY